MASKHTPGPWSPGYKTLNVVAVNAKIGGDTPVCDIRGWGYLTGNGHGALGLSFDEAVSIQEANARLIAAAPDLLEALKAMADYYGHALVSSDFPTEAENMKSALAAISKAEEA